MDALHDADVQRAKFLKQTLGKVEVVRRATVAVVDDCGRDHLVLVMDVDSVTTLEIPTRLDGHDVVVLAGRLSTASWSAQLATSVPGCE